MDHRITRDVRCLKLYAVCSTLATGFLATAAFVRGPQRQLNQQGIQLQYLGRVPHPYTAQHITANRFRITVRDLTEAQAETSTNYTGQPISLELKDADLRDVIGMFGKLTGFEMRIDDSIDGRVSVVWHNVPWDQAFDSLLKDNGLQYRIEGKTIIVSKK